ncbi:unnamed protein product [Rotaria magnacalcarata]|uniref:Uncharacterized protein n=1 Tax=Rotaria magnacalcarata TaxID=392030 RepID=A0A816QRB3_9BILA|nr:unnamed protein product [Rotaria magnacalcarata]CAF4235848.1 unnamed protein product [Rotaria magnacalcarata]
MILCYNSNEGSQYSGLKPNLGIHLSTLNIMNINKNVGFATSMKVQQLPFRTVHRWIEGADTGRTVLLRPGHLTFDKFGSVYVAIRATNIVLRFALNSFFGATPAGSSTSGNGNNELHELIDIIVDDDLNIYVVDSKNEHVMKWPCNAAMDFLMISNLYSGKVVVMIFAPNSTDAFYFSDKQNDSMYLRSFGQSVPSSILKKVNTAIATLQEPYDLVNDPYTNLYVADKLNNRAVMFCVGLIVGISVVKGNSPPAAPTVPNDAAFGWNLNLYMGLLDGNVMKYTRL